MKKIFSLIFLCISIEGFCQNSSEEKCPVVSEKTFFNTGWILKDTMVIFKKDTSFFKIKTKGEGVIFSYSKKFDCPDIYDEEHADVLTWYIPDSISEFQINLENNSGQLDYNLSYVTSRLQMTSAKGIIKGSKQNNEWLITADVQIVIFRKRDNQRFNRMIQLTKNFTAGQSLF